MPSRQPLRALRAKTASASGSDADDSDDSDSLDLPLNKRSRMQAASDSSEPSEDEAGDDDDAATTGEGAVVAGVLAATRARASRGRRSVDASGAGTAAGAPTFGHAPL